jgi:hypothetical protein
MVVRYSRRQDVLRNRRDSVFSNTSLEASSSRNTTQRGQSRIRDPSREERPYPPSNSVYSATQIFDSTAYPAGQSHQSFSYPNQLPSSSQHPSSAGGSFTASPYKVSYSQGRSTAGQSYGSQGYSSDDHYQQHSTTNPAHIASSTQASTVSCPDCPSQGQYSGSPPYPETAIGEEDGIVLPTLQSAQQHVKMSSHAGKKHHSHHKKAVDQSSIWSEWAWDESSRQWYCSKKLATGKQRVF